MPVGRSACVSAPRPVADGWPDLYKALKHHPGPLLSGASRLLYVLRGHLAKGQLEGNELEGLTATEQFYAMAL
jgi:hypothetical protein